jgi:CheY-like chemotaxis protein
MPEMDGLALVHEVRRHAHLAGTQIVLLSSSDREQVAACKGLGVARYLTKPIKQSDLLDAVLAVLRPLQTATAARPAARPAGGPAPRSGLRILLAEDNVVNQRVAVRMLEKQAHSVRVVGNGREAVAAAAEEAFDLVLMDVQMPEMSGFEATERIRADEAVRGGHVPIIAMTAHAMKGDRERCLEAGMDGYVSKPVQARELHAAIAEALGPVPRPIGAEGA